jgi:hypothetical protein
LHGDLCQIIRSLCKASLKAIFDKVDVSSCGELTTRLFMK